MPYTCFAFFRFLSSESQAARNLSTLGTIKELHFAQSSNLSHCDDKGEAYKRFMTFVIHLQQALDSSRVELARQQ
jgi:hypothetical protein